MSMRYFSTVPQVNTLCFKDPIPLFNQTAENKIQITFKDGKIVNETVQNQLVNICMIQGDLQFCVKGEPYIVDEGDILNLNPHTCAPARVSDEDAILLTLVKAHGLEAIKQRLKCSPAKV